jgi:hypothetical protein
LGLVTDRVKVVPRVIRIFGTPKDFVSTGGAWADALSTVVRTVAHATSKAKCVRFNLSSRLLETRSVRRGSTVDGCQCCRPVCIPF